MLCCFFVFGCILFFCLLFLFSSFCFLFFFACFCFFACVFFIFCFFPKQFPVGVLNAFLTACLPSCLPLGMLCLGLSPSLSPVLSPSLFPFVFWLVSAFSILCCLGLGCLSYGLGLILRTVWGLRWCNFICAFLVLFIEIKLCWFLELAQFWLS